MSFWGFACNTHSGSRKRVVRVGGAIYFTGRAIETPFPHALAAFRAFWGARHCSAQKAKEDASSVVRTRSEFTDR